MHLKDTQYQVYVLGQASLPAGFLTRGVCNTSTAATELRASKCFGHIFKKKLLPLSYPNRSNTNPLAVPKRGGSDLSPSVGRSGSALGNGSAIDAKVS